MNFQQWHCLNGCGHVFLLNKVPKSKNPHKPYCPNCGERKTVTQKTLHVIDLKETEVRVLRIFAPKGSF